jgi:hypothetical protein
MDDYEGFHARPSLLSSPYGGGHGVDLEIVGVTGDGSGCTQCGDAWYPWTLERSGGEGSSWAGIRCAASERGGGCSAYKVSWRYRWR